MIFCTHCGHQNRNESSFCTFCGNGLPDDRYIVGRLVILDEARKREYLVADADRHIGRDMGNDIVIHDGEMSARHARIACRHQGFWLEDLHSTNGTYVNGERICASTLLRDEDLLKMGRTLMKFRI